MWTVSNPAAAFTAFVNHVLIPAKARHFAVLAGSSRGRCKALKALYHEFDPAVRPAAVKPKVLDHFWNEPCLVYADAKGFGVPFPSAREAYDALSLLDGWLILLPDGSAGIHRPEAPRWDDERFLAG